MKDLAVVIAIVLIAALTYIVAAYLWTGDLSEGHVGSLVIALCVGSLAAGLFRQARKKKT